MRGGLVQRGSTWSYVVRVRDPETGRSRLVKKGGYRTRAEAATARAEAQSAVAKGNFVRPGRQTLADFIMIDWLRRSTPR